MIVELILKLLGSDNAAAAGEEPPLLPQLRDYRFSIDARMLRWCEVLLRIP